MKRLESRKRELNPDQLSFEEKYFQGKKEQIERLRPTIEKLKALRDNVEKTDAELGLPDIPMGENTHIKQKDGYVYNKTKIFVQSDIKNDIAGNLLQKRVKGMWNSLPDDVRDIIGELKIKKSTAKGKKYQGGRYDNFTKILTMNINDATPDHLGHNFFHEIGHAKWHDLQEKNSEKVAKFIQKQKEIGWAPTKYSQSYSLTKIKNEDNEKRYRERMKRGGFIISRKGEEILIRNRKTSEDLYQNEIHAELNAYVMGMIPQELITAPKKVMVELLDSYKELWGLK